MIYLGAGLDTQPGVSPGGHNPEHIRCERERLCEVVLALRALLAGAALKAKTVAGVKTAVLATLVERLSGARYAVILWAAADLDPQSADLTIEAIVDLVNDLNQRTRSAGLPLGGNDGGMTAQSVTSWQSGFPPRTSFASGYPVHDPRRYATGRLLEAKAVDCLFGYPRSAPRRRRRRPPSRRSSWASRRRGRHGPRGVPAGGDPGRRSLGSVGAPGQRRVPAAPAAARFGRASRVMLDIKVDPAVMRSSGLGHGMVLLEFYY